MSGVKEREQQREGGGGEKWHMWLRQQMVVKRELLLIKVILFFFYAGELAFLPYLTLHMQTLGITVEEIAIIYSFLPIASILGPPVSGLFADKSGRYKEVMVVNFVLSMAFNVALLHVDPRQTNSLTLTCGADGHHLTWAACDFCNQQNNDSYLHLSLKNCKYTCEDPPKELQVCLHSAENHTFCLPVNVADEMSINGTALSWREEDLCSHSWYNMMYEGQAYQSLTCPEEDCPVECQVGNSPSCSHPDDPSNKPQTFWVYFALRMIGTFFISSAFTMCDATTLAVVKQHKGDFGIQRIYSLLGTSIGPLVSAFIIDNLSWNSDKVDYAPAFYFGSTLVLISTVLAVRLHFTVDKADSKVVRKLWQLITRLDIDIFLLMVLAQGSSWGFIESFLFVYLKELGAPTYLLGLTMTVGNIVAAPFMIFLERVVDKLGRHVVFFISFFMYSVRHFGYSIMPNAWWVFPFELLELFTSQLMWVAALTYCPILAPRGLLATMTGLTGSIHYSLGRGIGSLLGGFLIAKYGTSQAFRTFAYISLCCGFIYMIVHYTYLKNVLAKREAKHEQELRDQRSDEEKSMLGEEHAKIRVVNSGGNSDYNETSH